MKFISALWGIVAMLLFIVGFIPMLGWLNWVNIPFAALGLIISSLSGASTGKTLNAVAVFAGLIRLFWGGGIL
jgi:hypothetical protein